MLEYDRERHVVLADVCSFTMGWKRSGTYNQTSVILKEWFLTACDNQKFSVEPSKDNFSTLLRRITTKELYLSLAHKGLSINSAFFLYDKKSRRKEQSKKENYKI